MFKSLFGTTPGTTPADAPAPGATSLLDRLKAGIQKTRAGLMEKLEDAVSGRKEIDADVLEELEYALITADIGARTTAEILERIRQRVERHHVADAAELKSLIREHLLEILEATERPVPHVAEPPAVIMVVGVNGAGKTTSIGKLTRRLQSEGRTVLLCAADTFRAAAIEQLEVWAQRTGADLIRQQPGSDPSAVLFDALQAAKARKVDYVIVDTAGRLHTKTNLMAELEKMRRTAARVIPGAPHEVLLVLDATTGQNGLEQARKFTETSARHRHHSDQARRHRQGRRGGRHLARVESAHPLRRRGRAARRPAAVRCGEVRGIAYSTERSHGPIPARTRSIWPRKARARVSPIRRWARWWCATARAMARSSAADSTPGRA